MADEPEETKERDEWKMRADEALQMRQTVNQDLALQSQRMNDLAKLHESHQQKWEASLAELDAMLKATRETMAAADQARSELVSVTAALVKVAQVQQAMIQSLQEESQS